MVSEISFLPSVPLSLRQPSSIDASEVRILSILNFRSIGMLISRTDSSRLHENGLICHMGSPVLFHLMAKSYYSC